MTIMHTVLAITAVLVFWALAVGHDIHTAQERADTVTSMQEYRDSKHIITEHCLRGALYYANGKGLAPAYTPGGVLRTCQ